MDPEQLEEARMEERMLHEPLGTRMNQGTEEGLPKWEGPASLHLVVSSSSEAPDYFPGGRDSLPIVGADGPLNTCVCPRLGANACCSICHHLIGAVLRNRHGMDSPVTGFELSEALFHDPLYSNKTHCERIADDLQKLRERATREGKEACVPSPSPKKCPKPAECPDAEIHIRKYGDVKCPKVVVEHAEVAPRDILVRVHDQHGHPSDLPDGFGVEGTIGSLEEEFQRKARKFRKCEQMANEMVGHKIQIMGKHPRTTICDAFACNCTKKMQEMLRRQWKEEGLRAPEAASPSPTPLPTEDDGAQVASPSLPLLRPSVSATPVPGLPRKTTGITTISQTAQQDSEPVDGDFVKYAQREAEANAQIVADLVNPKA
eukprot:TRINITY_DN10556_c0_g1_i1.p1 TRINITY_DN10556_c0_g1~~TRINITY_DN10556_c0_g1_i1.p1  ORF type:complete len:434 (+),score=94.96 TRINITY_DN10556_c0_g1_i1:181-1302(+)